jgi:hypothetical protein
MESNFRPVSIDGRIGACGRAATAPRDAGPAIRAAGRGSGTQGQGLEPDSKAYVATDRFRNRQRPLRLGGGNRSSCPEADPRRSRAEPPSRVENGLTVWTAMIIPLGPEGDLPQTPMTDVVRSGFNRLICSKRVACARSCPKEWCKSGGSFALSGRAGRYRQAAATAGSLTRGSSLKGAMVSSVM